MFFVILLSIFLVFGCQAQVPGTGPCRPQKLVPNFNAQEVLGHWFGYARYSNCDPPGRCRRSEYIDAGNGSLLNFNKQISVEPDTFVVYETGEVWDHVADSSYVISRTMTMKPYIGAPISFWNTDYTSYLVTGVCINVGPSSLSYVWIETRARIPSQSVLDKIDEAIKMDGIHPELLLKYNQTGCPSDF